MSLVYADKSKVTDYLEDDNICRIIADMRQQMFRDASIHPY